MKTLSIIFTACIFSCATLSAQPDYLICSSDLFATDTENYFFISEIKPFGTDRFVELYNCRSCTYTADMIYLSGMYSGVIDSFAHVIIPPYQWIVLPAPDELYLSDAVRALCRNDTRYKIMSVVGYTLTDSSKSIGLCDWYHAMAPTPGTANLCAPTAIYETPPESEKVSVGFYDLAGAQIPEPHGLCFMRTTYKNGRVLVRKIAQAYDDE